MTPRLASGVEVSALIRRIEGMGGHAMVLAKGDRDAGAILLVLAERGVVKALLDRAFDGSGGYRWRQTSTQDVDGYQKLADYIGRRRGRDPDLWVVELDVAGVERFADEMIASG